MVSVDVKHKVYLLTLHLHFVPVVGFETKVSKIKVTHF